MVGEANSEDLNSFFLLPQVLQLQRYNDCTLSAIRNQPRNSQFQEELRIRRQPIPFCDSGLAIEGPAKRPLFGACRILGIWNQDLGVIFRTGPQEFGFGKPQNFLPHNLVALFQHRKREERSFVGEGRFLNAVTDCGLNSPKLGE